MDKLHVFYLVADDGAHVLVGEHGSTGLSELSDEAVLFILDLEVLFLGAGVFVTLFGYR